MDGERAIGVRLPEAQAPSGTSTRPRKDSHAVSGPLSIRVRVRALPLFSLLSFVKIDHFPRFLPLSPALSRFSRVGRFLF